MKLLGERAAAADAAVLEHEAESILEVLQDSMNHKDADVRKAVVFAIVDMYRVLGVLIPQRKNIVEMDRNYVGGPRLLRWSNKC